MNAIGSMLFLYTETSLHAGSGTALGAVDLPIQRERMSGLPLVQGSGIKGAMREHVKRHLKGALSEEEWKRDEHCNLWVNLFGHEPPKAGAPQAADSEMFAGALSLTDARLLLFPVRTVVGGWAWATCPMVLQRLVRDLDTARHGGPAWGETAPEWMSASPAEGSARVGTRSTVLASEALLIEDLEFDATRDAGVDVLATWLQKNAFPAATTYEPFRKRLPEQLVVLSDTDFKFLTEHATEVVARIRISSKTGTVEKGALWSEESLPAETVLYSLALVTDGRRPEEKPNGGGAKQGTSKRKTYTAAELGEALQSAVKEASRIGIGGDRTTGRGMVALRASKGGV